MPARLIIMTGSARRDALNRKTALALKDAAERAGAATTWVEPADFILPLYDGDLEATEGLPEAAARLQAMFAEHDGLLLAGPEYNGFFSPLVKNTFDWLSRPLPGEPSRPGTVHFRGKPAGIATASPGALGGIRSLQHTRQYLSNLGFLVVPDQLGIPLANKAFDADGGLVEERARAGVETLARSVVMLAERLRQGA